MDEHLGHLTEAYRSGRVGRRAFVRWAATLGVSARVISALLAACAPTAPAASPTTGSSGPAPTAASASGAPTPIAQPRRGGTMRVTGSPAVEINPHKLTSNGGIITVFPCLTFLVRVDGKGVPQPELATAWTPSADAKTWTFTLRQGVTFHDGTAFKA